MQARRQFVASDGNTYDVEIRGPQYVVSRDGDVIVAKSVPNVVGDGISEEDAALEFARNDVEAVIKAGR